MTRKSSIACALIVTGQIVLTATDALAEKGDSGGARTERGGGGAAPLPALGLTLLGQALGAGGLYAAWRRRKSRHGQTP